MATRPGRLTLPAFLRVTGGAAAARFGLSGRKGAIAVGMDADLVLVDPLGEYEVRGHELLSKGTITPFEGMRLAVPYAVRSYGGGPYGMRTKRTGRGNAAAGIVAGPGTENILRWGYR